jgi:hypothetical protein
MKKLFVALFSILLLLGCDQAGPSEPKEPKVRLVEGETRITNSNVQLGEVVFEHQGLSGTKLKINFNGFEFDKEYPVKLQIGDNEGTNTVSFDLKAGTDTLKFENETLIPPSPVADWVTLTFTAEGDTVLSRRLTPIERTNCIGNCPQP